MLFIINFRHSPGVWWFFFPLIGWGAFLIQHYLASEYWAKKCKSPPDKAKIAFYTNLGVFIPIGLMLIITNYIYSPDIYWSMYPVLAWGAILALQHIFIRK